MNTENDVQIQHTEVSVIIVNYNTATEVVACVSSLLRQEAINMDIWVIDNQSLDESVSLLQRTFGDQIYVICSTTNLGFGKANNLGAQKALGQYLYFINPDAQLQETQALRTLVDYAIAHPHSGLIGTTVIDTASKQPIHSAYQYPGERHLKSTPGLKHLPGQIAWIQGSSMLMRKNLFRQLQGFDPDYFLYAEETDLCLRVRKAGFTIDVCSEVSIEHIGGASQVKNSIENTRLRKQQSLYLFYQKHYHHKDCQRLAKRACLHSRLKLIYLKLFKVHFNTAIIRQQIIYQAARQYLALK